MLPDDRMKRRYSLLRWEREIIQNYVSRDAEETAKKVTVLTTLDGELAELKEKISQLEALKKGKE